MSRAALHAAGVYAASLVTAAALAGCAVRGVGGALPLGRVSVLMLVTAALAHAFLCMRPTERVSRRVEALVTAGAVVAAIVFLVSPPAYSSDMFRYLLDGRVGASGLNPFAYAPDSPKIAEFVVGLPGPVNHPELPTIYPPGAQAAFALNAHMGSSVLGWRVLCLGVLFAGAAVLELVRPRAGVLRMGVALVAHPLAIVTACSNGNLDVVGPLFIAAFLLAARGRFAAFAGATLGAAAAFKLFPLGFAAALPGSSGLRRTAVAIGVALCVLAASYVPLAGLGVKASGSLGRYTEAWEYNSSVHGLLTAFLDRGAREAGVPASVPIEARRASGSDASPARFYAGQPSSVVWRARRELASKAARLLGLTGVGLLALWGWRQRWGPARAASAIFFGFLLTSPVVHPWYGLWLLPAALAAQSRVALLFCATIVLAFWAPAAVLDSLDWSDPLWVRCLEYGAVVIAAIGWERTKKRAHTPHTPVVSGV